MKPQFKWIVLACVCAFPLWGTLFLFYTIGINLFAPGIDPFVYFVVVGVFDIFLISNHADMVFADIGQYIALSIITFIISFGVLLAIGIGVSSLKDIFMFVIALFVIHVVDILIIPFNVYVQFEKTTRT